MVDTHMLILNPRASDLTALALDVKQHTTSQDASTFLASWRCKPLLDVIKDKFNDALDFDITTFDQIIVMNHRMLTTMKHHVDALIEYGADESTRGKELLIRFVRNYAVLNKELKALQERMTKPHSELPEARKKAEALSASVRDLMIAYVSSFSILAIPTLPTETVTIDAAPRYMNVDLRTIGCTVEHEALLRAWVAEVTGKPIAAKLALLFKASEADDCHKNVLHSLCAKHGRLLYVFREQHRGWLFGGFTSEPLQSGKSRRHVDHTAFLFTLTNPHGIPPTRYGTMETTARFGQGTITSSPWAARLPLTLTMCMLTAAPTTTQVNWWFFK
jgi:hypothetical protein